MFFFFFYFNRIYLPNCTVSCSDDPLAGDDRTATEVIVSTAVDKRNHPGIFVHLRLYSTNNAVGTVDLSTSSYGKDVCVLYCGS